MGVATRILGTRQNRKTNSKLHPLPLLLANEDTPSVCRSGWYRYPVDQCPAAHFGCRDAPAVYFGCRDAPAIHLCCCYDIPAVCLSCHDTPAVRLGCHGTPAVCLGCHGAPAVLSTLPACLSYLLSRPHWWLVTMATLDHGLTSSFLSPQCRHLSPMGPTNRWLLRTWPPHLALLSK